MHVCMYACMHARMYTYACMPARMSYVPPPSKRLPVYQAAAFTAAFTGLTGVSRSRSRSSQVKSRRPLPCCMHACMHVHVCGAIARPTADDNPIRAEAHCLDRPLAPRLPDRLSSYCERALCRTAGREGHVHVHALTYVCMYARMHACLR